MEKSVFIEKDNIEFKDKRLLFSKQIPIRITFEEGLWIFENEKLEILSYGETFDLAWISFREDIIFIWELLGKEKESKLDTKAIEIKRILEDLVVSEESLGEQKK